VSLNEWLHSAGRIWLSVRLLREHHGGRIGLLLLPVHTASQLYFSHSTWPPHDPLAPLESGAMEVKS